ncbi:MAG: hypothetical protein JNN00_18580 [Chitinophagaceae bacterium]|nr:hypothetical protein [Chitinophagaceae bacterium]
MKNYLFFVLLLTACNNSDDDKAADTSAEKDKPAVESGKKSSSTGACSKLIFFHPGAEVEARSYNADGEAVSSQHTKILDVKSEDGMTVAYVEGADLQSGADKPKVVNYSYKCDGNKIYFDVASMFRDAQKQKDATFESSLIEYPINVKEGESLPDATGVMKAEKNGKKMEMKYHFINRKVEGKEEVTTPAGTWNCFKISHDVEVEMDIPGMNEKAKEMMKTMQGNIKTTTITWMAPDFGIVKMEMYMNDKLASRNEVVSFKK